MVLLNHPPVPDGMTALFAASLEGRAEIVELLLARSDTEVNLPRVDDSEGMSPLYAASLKGASINDVSSEGGIERGHRKADIGKEFALVSNNMVNSAKRRGYGKFQLRKTSMHAFSGVSGARFRCQNVLL